MPEFGFLSGLPRTGSTLLCCVLGQNPDVFVSGTSPMSRFMIGVHDISEGLAKEALTRVRRTEFTEELISELPNIYYRDISQRYILEKDRAWAYDPMNFLRAFTNNPRIVVLLRSIPEIVQSFVHVKVANGDALPERDLLVEELDPLVNAFRNTIKALESLDDRYLFGTYEQLVRDPISFTRAVYSHYGWDWYDHDFDNIQDLNLEDDAAMHTQGLHEVRTKIEHRALNTRVSKNLLQRAQDYDDHLWEMVRMSLKETPQRHI